MVEETWRGKRPRGLGSLSAAASGRFSETPKRCSFRFRTIFCIMVGALRGVVAGSSFCRVGEPTKRSLSKNLKGARLQVQLLDVPPKAPGVPRAADNRPEQRGPGLRAGDFAAPTGPDRPAARGLYAEASAEKEL